MHEPLPAREVCWVYGAFGARTASRRSLAGGVLGLRGAWCAICLRAQPGQSKTDSDLTWRTWAVRASTAYSYSMAWYMKLTS